MPATACLQQGVRTERNTIPLGAHLFGLITVTGHVGNFALLELDAQDMSRRN